MAQTIDRINQLKNHQLNTYLKSTAMNKETKTQTVRFESTDIRKSQVRGLLTNNQEGKFTFSMESIRTLLIGSKIYLKDYTGMFRPHANLITNLSLIELDGHDGTFNRAEVEMMRSYVEARLTHCEAEREEDATREIETSNNKSGFNPDTYISMKLLLLDIREWLIGEVIED